MKTKISEYKDYNVYMTEADCSRHSTVNSIDTTTLSSLTSIYSIVCKHIILAASHVYESSPTYTYLLSNPDLIESGIVTIDLRNDCRDFTDFQDFQYKHTMSPFWISDEATKISQFLNDHCPFVIPWNPSGSEASFKNCLLNSLDDSNSSIRRILHGTEKKYLQQVKHEIEDKERITRSILDQMFTIYSPQVKHSVMREISIAYYIIGAYDLRSRPALHPNLFSHYQKCLEPIGIMSSDSKLVDSAFSSLLKQYQFITSDILDQLSVQQLIDIRHSQVINEFRKKWWGILDDAIISTDVGSYNEIERSVYELISSELRNEKKKNRNYGKFKKAIGAASLVVSGMSLIPCPLLACLSFGLSALSFSGLTDPLFEKNAGIEFTAITRKIIESKEKVTC